MDDLSYLRDSAIRQERELSSLAKRLAKRRAFFSRSTVLKTATALVVLSMLSTLLAGSGGWEPAIRTTAYLTTFEPPVIANDKKTNTQAMPIIVAAPDHGLFVVWQDSRSGNEDIYVSTSLDNGTTFGPNKRADDSNGSSKQIEPAVAVSGNGTILLTWQDNRRSTFDYDVFLTKSYDGGATFTRNVKVDDSNGVISWQERPSIAVTVGGTIYVAWTDDRTHNLRVRGAFSADGGVTFSPSKEIVASGGTSGQTGVSLESNGDCIFAAFTDNVTGIPHPYLCISTDGGRSFANPIRLDSTGSGGVSQRSVSTASMPGGGMIAVWEDSRNGNWDIYAAIVSADGKISTSDFRVDDDSTSANQKSPCVAADQFGNIYAVWEDERKSSYAIRFAYLAGGKTQFTSSIEVATPGGNDMQRRPSIITTEPGRVFVAWQDDRAGSYDVYSSGAHFPDLFGLYLVNGWNFVSVPSVGHGYMASTLDLAFGDMVARWDPATQTYDKTYIVGFSSAEFDFAISESTGCWIYAGAAKTLHLKGSIPTTTQSIAVSVPAGGGWVVIGLNSLNTTLRASAVSEMYSGGSVLIVASYDPIAEAYTSYCAGMPSTDFVLFPGRACWCWCSASGALTYDP